MVSANPLHPKAQRPVTFRSCPGGFSCQDLLRAWTTTTNDMAGLTSCVAPSLKHRTASTGILNLLPITYAFRPRLRGRLTLGGRTFPRKPQDSGGRDSHPAFRYSCPHNHFHAIHGALPRHFASHATLLYHFPALLRAPGNPQLRQPVQSRSFSARNHSTSQLLRTV
jgi:hypothetical protein